MNIHVQRPSRSEAGITLLECLVYLGVLAVLVGCGVSLLFRCWTDSNALHRNATDIERVLHAGEQWRADVRAARGPVSVTVDNGVEQLSIPSTNGNILYTFFQNSLTRWAVGEPTDRLWLDHVKTSQMQSETRGKVTAWRWELELQSSIKTVKFHPLFTFETVTGGGPAQ